jgi:hypothetical protein
MKIGHRHAQAGHRFRAPMQRCYVGAEIYFRCGGGKFVVRLQNPVFLQIFRVNNNGASKPGPSLDE